MPLLFKYAHIFLWDQECLRHFDVFLPSWCSNDGRCFVVGQDVWGLTEEILRLVGPPSKEALVLHQVLFPVRTREHVMFGIILRMPAVKAFSIRSFFYSIVVVLEAPVFLEGLGQKENQSPDITPWSACKTIWHCWYGTIRFSLVYWQQHSSHRIRQHTFRWTVWTFNYCCCSSWQEFARAARSETMPS